MRLDEGQPTQNAPKQNPYRKSTLLELMNDIRRRGLSLSERVAHLRDALGIGLEATSGAEAELKTDGLYRRSRNPHYFADIGILIGWANLSASANLGGIATGGVVAFALAPAA